MAEPEYPVLQELETKLKLLWVDTDDVMATQRAIIEVTPDHAYLELPRGRKGDKGDPGNAISFQGIVARTSDLPTGLGASDAAKAWVNTATKALHVWNGDQWFTVDNFAGVDADVQRFSQWFAQAADAARTAVDAAQRAEYWANETIQQVTGDFATKNYADSKDWHKGFINDSHQSMGDVPVGAWGISARNHAERLGLPSDFGSLQVMQIGASRSAFFLGQTTGFWTATEQGGVWGEWKKTPDFDDVVSAAQVGGAGLKTAAVALTAGSLLDGTPGRVRLLTQVTAPVTRWRVHIESRRMVNEASSEFVLGNVYVGHHTGGGNATGLTTLKTGSIPVPGSVEWVSKWITHDLSQETVVDFDVSGTGLFSYQAPGFKFENGSWVTTKNSAASVWIEVETSAQTPVVALIGDSTGSGQGADLPVHESALHIAARKHRFIPMLYAYPGSSMQSINNREHHLFQRWAGLTAPDSVIIQSGSNDIHAGTSVADLRTRFTALAELAKTISPVVIGSTVKARYPDSGEHQANLNSHNTWVKTQPAGIRDFLDFYAKLSPNGTVAAADAADAAHLTTRGHEKLALAFDDVTVAREELSEVLAAKADKSESDTYGGFQDASVDVNTLLAGGTNSDSRVFYRMAPGGNTPDGGVGVLDVTNTGNQFTQVFYSATNNSVWQRTITDRSHIVPGQWIFGEWKKLATHDDLEAKADKSEAVTYGGFQASNVSMDTLLAGGTNSNSRVYYRINGGGDSPDGNAGVLVTTNAGYIFSQEFFSATTAAVYTRIITDRSHIVPDQWLFGEWQRQAVDDKTRMAAGEARRAAVVEAGLKRRGGVVGTGGKPAIALRFDHHLQQFGDKVLPHLKRLRLPWGQMINANNIGSGNDTWTWAQLATECHNSGGEVWNHALTHGDVNSVLQADQAVTLGLSSLKENLPSLWIDSWAPPGQPNYMGFTNQAEPEKFYDTYPGKLVLAQHAFVRGSYPAPHHPLNGQNLIGQSHVTIDAQTAAWCEAAVRSARDTGSGLTMMLHSNYLDQAGYMTTNELVQVLEYIAARRDAGELVVLSNAGILMADASVPVRQTNLLSNAGAGTNTGTWSQSVTSRSYLAHLGVPHEAETWVKGSGQVTLKVEVSSPTNAVTAQHQVTLGSAPQRLSVLVTPPLDTTGITVSLAGNVTHTGINYRPI